MVRIQAAHHPTLPAGTRTAFDLLPAVRTCPPKKTVLLAPNSGEAERGDAVRSQPALTRASDCAIGSGNVTAV